ncbi:hypothetical protein [Deinococcus roseus]|uniref:Uncharacterized protein n=1 Tax=Deinococcus roseus TaxID=392414 RepID=A0ABQ2CZA9_9DEIO|nr:hypothetical protein [Deinococcus roseus]GGJ35792.1 hypothetical protein GCM10008938_22420 [Deinococcus roseus]
MSETHYVPVFSRFTLQEMMDHAPTPWFGILGFILSRFGLINTDQGNPAPGPVAEDLAPFEEIPEDFRSGVNRAVGFMQQHGFEVLSYTHTPSPTVAGAYLLHQNQQWVAYVACVKDTRPGAAQAYREVYSLLGFSEEGQCYSVTTAPFMQVPHVSRIFLRNAAPDKVLSTFEKHVQGKNLKSLHNMQEVEEVVDEMSLRSHRVLVTRGAKKAIAAPAQHLPEEDPDDLQR